MEILKIENYKEYIGKTIDDWVVIDSVDMPDMYIIVLSKDSNQRTFYIRKTVIKGHILRLENDVYDLWYNEFKQSKLLTLSEVLDIDIVLSKILEFVKIY